jgi:hypothetical protein
MPFPWIGQRSEPPWPTARNNTRHSRYTSGPIRLNGGNGSTQTITADEQANYGFVPNPDGSGTAYTYTKTPISTFELDNVWFSQQKTNSSR